MMKRQIFLWMGLIVLFAAFGFTHEVLAKEYTVKRGDNLAKIARKFGTTPQALREANNLSTNALKPKQVLIIPDRGKRHVAKSTKTKKVHTEHQYVVKKGDTLQRIATKTGVSVKELQRINNVNPNSLRVGQKLALSKPYRTRDVRLSRIEEPSDDVEVDDLLDEDEDELSSDDTNYEFENFASNSDVLGKWNSAYERSLFVRVAKGFLGAPYRLGGNSVRGLDCSAFVKKIYQFFDVNLPRTAKEQARVGKRISRDELKEGDLVFFNTRRPLGHVGIYIGNNEFVHAAAGRQRVVRIDTLDKPYYNKRFVTAVRVKELDDGV